jgi:hypothetical protein
MVLSVQPLGDIQAASHEQVKNSRKIEKSVSQRNIELLHSELLFK